MLKDALIAGNWFVVVYGVQVGRMFVGGAAPTVAVSNHKRGEIIAFPFFKWNL